MSSLKIARNRNILVPNENASNSSNCSFTCLKGTVIFSTHVSHVLPVKNSSEAPNSGSPASAPQRGVGQPLGRAAGPRLRRRRAQSVLSPVPRLLRPTTRRLPSAREAGWDHRLLRTEPPPQAFARRHLFV